MLLLHQEFSTAQTETKEESAEDADVEADDDDAVTTRHAPAAGLPSVQQCHQ